MGETIHLPPLQYTFLDDNILEATYDDGNWTISRELAEKIVFNRLQIQCGKSYRLLIYGGNARLKLTHDAKKYIDSDVAMQGVACMAILLDGWTTFTVFRLISLFQQRPDPPVAVFKERAAAIDWLRKQKLAEDINLADDFAEDAKSYNTEVGKRNRPNADKSSDFLNSYEFIIRAEIERNFALVLADSLEKVNASRDKAIVEEVKKVIEKAMMLCSRSGDDYEKLQIALSALIPPIKEDKIRRLSPIKYEIVKGLAIGLTTKGIAKKLEKSPRTIEAHRRELYEQFHVFNGLELIQRLNETGFLDRS